MIETKFDRAMKDFVWNIIEIHSQLGDIHSVWARLLGITEPQWLMLMAIMDLDKGLGVAGIDVAKKLRVHPGFVASQTKSLAKAGLLERRTRSDDARFVQMSLTEQATTAIAKLSKKKASLSSTMFADLGEGRLAELNTALFAIAKNVRLAARLLAIEIS
ncbi:MarR family winged helix-turn-helix transcriptional regulator [Bradyrhizobium sp. 141]|uniref:MarR family winged helix-turn-helix transcriptional regulator n=1 Tax=Bradyrhizobium sp. 141 TaxID=2782617 RepID=UPI001FF9C88E|nr:MarR family winged helix-turn-helix transcriptional regulator [Bradyrhizobium sp. 141]MCK1718283.1 winged helix-turn-helix transcriptional regulator [Bradyrhizobium sp. 141]